MESKFLVGAIALFFGMTVATAVMASDVMSCMQRNHCANNSECIGNCNKNPEYTNDWQRDIDAVNQDNEVLRAELAAIGGREYLPKDRTAEECIKKNRCASADCTGKCNANPYYTNDWQRDYKEAKRENLLLNGALAGTKMRLGIK